jgi:hypothetical protein
MLMAGQMGAGGGAGFCLTPARCVSVADLPEIQPHTQNIFKHIQPHTQNIFKH